MTTNPLRSCPDYLLTEPGTKCLRDWLAERGQTVSLLDLGLERRRRGLRTSRPYPPTSPSRRQETSA